MDSPRLLQYKNQKRKNTIRNTGLYACIFVTIIILLSFLSRIDKFKIKDVNINGNSIVDTETIKALVSNELKGNYLYFLPKTNILFYPKNKIQNALLLNFKRLKDVNISLDKDRNLIISVSERKGFYIWCGFESNFEIENTSKESCYFMDDQGYVFDKAPYFSGQVYFKFYGYFTNNSNEDFLGKYFKPSIFSKLITIKERVSLVGLKPLAIYILPSGEIDMYLARGKNSLVYPKIIFKEDNDFEKIQGDLESALSTEPLKTNIVTNYGNLLYLDLKIKNKVFYKFK